MRTRISNSRDASSCAISWVSIPSGRDADVALGIDLARDDKVTDQIGIDRLVQRAPDGVKTSGHPDQGIDPRFQFLDLALIRAVGTASPTDDRSCLRDGFVWGIDTPDAWIREPLNQYPNRIGLKDGCGVGKDQISPVARSTAAF